MALTWAVLLRAGRSFGGVAPDENFFQQPFRAGVELFELLEDFVLASVDFLQQRAWILRLGHSEELRAAGSRKQCDYLLIDRRHGPVHSRDEKSRRADWQVWAHWAKTDAAIGFAGRSRRDSVHRTWTRHP